VLDTDLCDRLDFTGQVEKPVTQRLSIFSWRRKEGDRIGVHLLGEDLRSGARAMWRSAFFILRLALIANCGSSAALSFQPVPQEIRQIFEKPIYQKAVWGMQVVDLDTGRIIYDVNFRHWLLIGTVRKLFSIGVA
jgi:hypothetical protein